MKEPALQQRVAVIDYLSWEEQQPDKHEYVRGEVFAMVGARREHVVVSGNLYAAFKQRLRGGPCQAYVSDLNLRVEAADAFFYPDVMVSCDRRDHSASQFVGHPTLIIEVLSESTEAFDRGEKFAAYRTLRSPEEYALVDIPSRRVESFRRTADGDWLFHDHRAEDGDCRFASIEVSVPFDEIFENVAGDEARPDVEAS